MTRASVLAAALALALAGCSWGFLHDGAEPTPAPEPEPVDTVAPVLEVRPPGGAYAAIQYVTLAASEPATVRYTLDGTDPAGAGSAAAHAAPSPVFWLRMASGTTVLRAVAVDAAGNVSAPVSETYVVSLPPAQGPPPTLTLLSAPLDPVPLLSVATVRWQADAAVTWRAELGGAGTPGWGTFVAGGSADPGVAVSVAVAGWDVQGVSSTLWVHVADAAGQEASLRVPLAPAAPVIGAEVGSGNGCWDLAVSADGRRVYATAGPAVKVVDADPASATHDQVLATLAIPGDEAVGLKLAPDGARVWVAAEATFTRSGGVFAVAVADGAVTPIATTSSGVPWFVLTADGARAYVERRPDDRIVSLDADPASSTFGGDLRETAAFATGRLELAAAGLRVVDTMGGVLDVDPSSPTFETEIGLLQAPLYVGFASWPVPAREGGRVHFATCPAACEVWAFDPLTYVSVAHGALGGAQGMFWTLAAPDPDVLLAAWVYGASLKVLGAQDLSLRKDLVLPLPAGWGLTRIVPSPDGRVLHALAWTGEPGAAACRLVRVPLR